MPSTRITLATRLRFTRSPPGAWSLSSAVIRGAPWVLSTVRPTGAASPGTTSLYYSSDLTGSQTNTTIVALSGAGTFQVKTDTAVNMTMDVEGYFTSGATAAGGYVPLSPASRIVDTRSGIGLAQARLLNGSTTVVDVAALAGQVPTNASAVFVNFEVVNRSSQAGHIVPFETGTPRTAAGLSFPGSVTTSASATVSLGSGAHAGKISVYLAGGPVDLLVNVIGYYTAAPDAAGAETSYFTPGTARLVDGVTLSGNSKLDLMISGPTGMPTVTRGLTAVALNLQVRQTSSTGGGHVGLWPDDEDNPGTTVLNYQPGVARSNFATVRVGSNGGVTLSNGGPQSVKVYLDLQGWYAVPSMYLECDNAVGLTPQQDALVVTADGVTGTLALDGTSEGLRAFSGTIAGEEISAEVLYGSTDTQIEQALAVGETYLDDLGNASEAGAVDGDVENEVTETFENLPDAVAVNPIAYTIQGDDWDERGAPQGSEWSANSTVAAECVRDEASSVGGANEVPLITSGGPITVPRPSASGNASLMSAPNSQRSSVHWTSTAFRYRTFLPNAEVNGGPCGVFKGDNRAFTTSWNAPSRTKANVFFDWANKKLITSKDVGATHRLAKNGFSAKTRTASSSGIKFHTATIAPTYGRLVISHAVSNPLCSVAGDVVYNVVVEVWKNGAARVSGTRLKAPNHEAYIYPRLAQTGQTIFRRTSSALLCLNVNCGVETIRVSIG